MVSTATDVKTRLVPKGPRVMLLPYVQEKTAGGILLIDNHKKNFVRGTVVSAGSGCKETWEPGTEVLYGNMGLLQVQDEDTGEDLVFVMEQNIIAAADGGPMTAVEKSTEIKNPLLDEVAGKQG